VEVDAATLLTTFTSAAEPVDAQRPTVLAVKSMSYAKLYQVPAVNAVPHCSTLETIHWRLVAVGATPILSSVKCDSKKAI